MTRLDQIKEAAKSFDSDKYFGFIEGAKWADENPMGHGFAIASALLELLGGVLPKSEKKQERFQQIVDAWKQMRECEKKLKLDLGFANARIFDLENQMKEKGVDVK